VTGLEAGAGHRLPRGAQGGPRRAGSRRPRAQPLTGRARLSEGARVPGGAAGGLRRCGLHVELSGFRTRHDFYWGVCPPPQGFCLRLRQLPYLPVHGDRGDNVALEPLTPQQRSAALDKAFKARQARAEIKSALKNGQTDLAAVLKQAADDEALAKMRVLDLLRALPGVGDRRAEAAMEEVGIATSRRIKGLGVHQKSALLEKYS